MILEIGCLCCDTPTNMIGIVATKEEAEQFCAWYDKYEATRQNSCIYIPIQEDEYIHEEFADMWNRYKQSTT